MLLAIEQHGIDVFSEMEKMFGRKAELAVPEQVLEELRSMEGKKTEKPARIAAGEIERHKVKTVHIDAANADDALAKMSKEGYAIASNDAALRKRIKGFGGKVIYLRQLRFLEQG